MAKHKGDMSPSQRARYNRYHRLRHLERELQKGKIPVPRFKPDAKLLELYQRYNAEYAVSLPLPHISKDLWRKIKAHERKLLAHAKQRFRDQFPADMKSDEFRALWREAKPVITRFLLEP